MYFYIVQVLNIFQHPMLSHPSIKRYMPILMMNRLMIIVKTKQVLFFYILISITIYIEYVKKEKIYDA